MKKNILLACALALVAGFTSCSGDFEDASSKHVYSETDEVPLNTAAGAWEVIDMEFPTTQLTTVQSISLNDYASDIQKQLGVSASEVINAVNSGALKFKVISASRGNWSTSPYTYNTGWYFNTSNKACEAAEGVATVVLNSAKNTIDIALTEGIAAGSTFDINVGIGKPDAQYGTFDKYVRFESKISVTDPTVILATFDMAEGDYAGYEFFFENNYDNQFKACLGMTAQEALNGLESGTVGFYITDADGNITGRDYTADAGDGYYGYWLDWNAQNYGWKSGASVYVDAELNERALYFGRFPEAASHQGKTLKVYLKMALKSDESKYIRFIISLNM